MKLLPLTPLLATLVLAAPASAGNVLYVDANLATGLNDGSSWDDAFQGSDGLRAAIAGSAAGDQIWVADGTYLPTTTTTRTLSFNLRNGVEIYGSFAGGETSLADRPALGTSPSILSGDLAGNDGTNQLNDNSFHVVNGSGTNATAVLDGFVIRGGNANSSGGNNDRGGGIICTFNVSPTIRNCDFLANRCIFGGGAGYVNGNPSFTNCSFVDNIGGSFGGAFDIAQAGAVQFDRCTFVNNQAARAGALEIFATGGVVVANSTFRDNTATGTGGGAFWVGSGGSTDILNCSIVGNNATSSAAGGVLVQGSNVTIANTICWDNAGSNGAQLTANQISGTNNVTYSIVEGGFNGFGNSSTAPQFVDLAGGDLALLASSPGIDAGNNAAAADGLLDHAGNARYADVPSVDDTGFGSTPVIDIGAFEFSDPAYPVFCKGDGQELACPCNNDSPVGHLGGCAHDDGPGAILTADGAASVSADTLQFSVTSGPQNSFCVLFSGDNLQAPSAMFDGLRCVSGGLQSHGARRITFTGAASGGFGTAAGPPGGILQQGGFSVGQTRYFYAVYRTFTSQSCGQGQNSSNAVEVTIGS